MDNITLIENLKEKNLKLACAESLTGGMFSKCFTDMEGVSACFLGGVCAYSNDIKINVINVDKALIEKYSAVSKQVALAMAKGVKNLFEADICVSCTGEAGPVCSTDNPVGTVYIAVVYDKKSVCKKYLFKNLNREEIRRQTVEKMAELIIDILRE